MDNADKAAFEALRIVFNDVDAEMRGLLPQISVARRAFFASRNSATQQVMEQTEARAQELQTRMNSLMSEMQEVIGLSDADVEALSRDETGRGGDKVPSVQREDLVQEKIPSSALVDDVLASSFDALLALVGTRRLEDLDRAPAARLTDLMEGSPLSLVRGIRPESERVAAHRFGQSIRLVQDLQSGHELYDHFAGAMLVPQVARLAECLPILRDIAGGPKRLRSLWKGPSAEVDSTLLELLVGAECAKLGRQPEFLDPAKKAGKSPDLFCHDPYPLGIECKRKKPLSQYELDEERTMRSLFAQVEAAARGVGMWGTFYLVLSVEASQAPASEIATALLQQRFAAGRVVTYGWGKIAYSESPAHVRISHTRLYSPHLLQQVFDWNSDLAEFDGIICSIANAQEPVVDVVERPVGLLWANVSERALQKRSWGPMSAVTEALQQIPSGDFGVIYVAYQEGARSRMADERLSGFAEWLHGMSHRDDIRVPVCKLIRLYPRALGEGAPDLIESTVTFTADFCDEVLPTILPSTVFTRSRID